MITNYTMPSGNIYFELEGQWKYNPKNHVHRDITTTFNWNAHRPSIERERCLQFGMTLSQCISGFMAYLTQFTNKHVTLCARDFVAAGACLLHSPETKEDLLFEDVMLRNYATAHHKALTKLGPVTQVIRDGFFTHTDEKLLGTVILNLVVSQPGALRQMIIMDELPSPASTRARLPLPYPVVFLHSIEQLTDPKIRHVLKATELRLYVRTSVVSYLHAMCDTEKVGSRTLNTLGPTGYKWARHTLGVCTVLSDLPWDRVITCTKKDTVLLPGQPKIGFWWTLCHPCDVVGRVTSVTNMSARAPWGFEKTFQLLTRHRMIDLTHAQE